MRKTSDLKVETFALVSYYRWLDKSIYNIISFCKSIIAIHCIREPITEDIKCKISRVNDDVVCCQTIDELLSTECHTVIWCTEVFGTIAAYNTWCAVAQRVIGEDKKFYNLARLAHAEEDSAVQRVVGYKTNTPKIFDAYKVDRNKLNQWKFARNMPMPMTGAQILIVVGTGTESGKFTSAMALKKSLDNQNDLKTAVIGTEPYSLLCGCDAMVLPQTYPLWAVPFVIADTLSQVETLHHPDIIIISSQTGINDYRIRLPGLAGAQVAFAFLFSIRVQTIILAAKFKDNHLIPQHINAIELLTGASVAGITLNCDGVPEEQSIRDVKRLAEHTNLPVVDPVKQKDMVKEFLQRILLEEKSKALTENREEAENYEP